MEFTPGTIIVAVAMALFYLRLAQLRGRKKKEIRKEELARIRKPKKKGQPIPATNPRVTYQIVSWWLVGLGALLMLFGLAVLTSTWFPESWQEYWWTATTAGVIVFIFCFK